MYKSRGKTVLLSHISALPCLSARFKVKMGLLKLSLALATVLLSPVLASPVGDYGGDDNGGPGLVRQKLELTWAPGAPDGNERMMIFTNGQFPAPPLVFDEDDDVEITVCNNMPANATVHWHGLE